MLPPPAADADAEGDTVALYALPSFLNHHWEPNLLVDYGDDDVVFRAARPVKEGDELTIDYIHEFIENCASAESESRTKEWIFEDEGDEFGEL